jgi:hypothetical protein
MMKMRGFVRSWLLLVLACFRIAESCGFDLDARIYPADSMATLRFRAVSAWGRKNFKAVKVGYVRDDRRFSDGAELRERGPRFENLKFTREGGDTIVVKVPLRGEHEHTFSFYLPRKKGEKMPEMRQVTVCTLGPDAFRLRPFKGEFHQHSNLSDGRTEARNHIQYARAAGLDFVAVTDHRKSEQNAIVAAVAKNSGCGLVTYPGEEMHNVSAILHSVCLGAPEAISVSKRTPELVAGAEPILRELRRELPDMHDSERRSLAEALCLARRARGKGAVLIYCHPHWRPYGRYNAPPEFTRYILTHDYFDAVEISNGQFGHHNQFTAALLYEIAAEKGKRWPVVSASDLHNVSNIEVLKRNYNILFAPNCSFAEFKKGLRAYRVVAAVETMTINKKRSRPAFFGSWKLVKLAAFLENIGYWKRHDTLAASQAPLLQKFLAGDESVVPELKRIAAEIDALRESIYCDSAEVVQPLGR